MIESNKPSLTSPPAFTLYIDDGAPEPHRVASSVLVSILENSQRAFELIGLYLESSPIKERATVSAAIRRRFQLVCNLPQPGSFAVPIAVEDLSGDLLFAEQREKAMDIFKRLMAGVFFSGSTGAPKHAARSTVVATGVGSGQGHGAARRCGNGGYGWREYDGQPFAEFDPSTIPFIRKNYRPAGRTGSVWDRRQ